MGQMSEIVQKRNKLYRRLVDLQSLPHRNFEEESELIQTREELQKELLKIGREYSQEGE